MCVFAWYQNITAQKTPGRLTRNTVRNTPLRPNAAQAVPPGSSSVGQDRSETRSGNTVVGQTDSPKPPAGSQRPSSVGKLRSPAVQKTPSRTLQSSSPAVDRSQRRSESSFVKDFGTDVDLEKFNTTESDEDIAKACDKIEDEVCLRWMCIRLLYTGWAKTAHRR